MGRSARPWTSRLPSCSTVDALSGCYPGDALVALRHLKISTLIFRDQSIAAGADLLPVLDSHVIETAQLPLLHQDPFDRLLIAQARVEGMMAVSSDRQWVGYDVSLHRL